ncbi:MAG: hypothetical protein ACLPXB_05060 [Thiobacillaceae bacterium]
MSVAAFTRLTQGVDGNGVPVVASIPQSNFINAMYFSGAGSQTQSLPTDASNRLPNFVLLSASQNVDTFMLFGSSAAVPSAGITNGTASEANAMIRQVQGQTQISVAVSAACVVTLAYYS